MPISWKPNPVNLSATATNCEEGKLAQGDITCGGSATRSIDVGGRGELNSQHRYP